MRLDFKNIPKYCISLKNNTARRITVSEEFKKIGINVKFFDAIDKDNLIVPELSIKQGNMTAPGVLGCALSHVELIRFARSKGWPAICIFEDDIVFCEDFHARIEHIESLEGFKFDMLTLGGHFNKEITPDYAVETKWPYMYRVINQGGTYGYIITERVYDFILRNYTYNYGADEFYGNFVYRRFNSFAFVPFLVGCRPCTSDITGQFWEYENIGWHFKKEGVPGLLKKQ